MRNCILILSGISLAFMLLSGACHRNGEAAAGMSSADFNSSDDTTKVAYMMKSVSPDSVARFICDASLGKLPDVTLDTFAIAAAYAYENYNDSSLRIFSEEIDSYSANLPLPEKMKIYFMAGKSDPQRMGYQLGLEYVNHIRENRMSVEEISKEIAAFKAACADDSVTYNRFIKGFHTVLKLDHGKDLQEEVYEAFINY